MKRLTTDKPSGNFETMLNFVYGKDGWAYIRHDGKKADVPLTGWAKKQCLEHGCDEFPETTPEEIDQEICDCMMDYPGCPVALAYCFASQAVHMRGRLKMYEDILFAEDGTERISLEQLRTMSVPPPNPPLTLEELREMDEPVWIEWCDSKSQDENEWALVNQVGCRTFKGFAALFEWYGHAWLAYRRKPEEGAI